MKNKIRKIRENINQLKKESQKAAKARKKKVYHDNGAVIVIRPSAWVTRGSLEYEDSFRRKKCEKYRSNITEEKMYSLTSQARDWFLELQLRSDKYTFNNMLAVVNPFGHAPLTAMVLFTTIMDYKVRATVVGDTKDTDFTYVYPACKRHRIPIIGMYADRKNHIRIELLDEEDTVCDTRNFEIETGKLPSELQDAITVKKVNPDALYSNILIAGGINIHTCVFDKQGQIRYYLKIRPKGYGIFPLSKGRFLFMEKDMSAPTFTNPHSVQMYDMDYLGRVGTTFLVKNGAHHTVEEKTPGGNILAAGNSLIEHSEDMVIEIDRTTGQIVDSICVQDVFDDTYVNMKDWAHINSANYNRQIDSMLVSMRNLHSVADFDWTKKEIRWILCDPRFWEGTEMEKYVLKPVGDVPYFYQQHAAFEVKFKTGMKPNKRYIMLFDNHWHKRRKVPFFDEDDQSYICFYEIDEKEMTVRLFKRIATPKSKIRSNAVYDMESNRLYIMGGFLVPEIDGNLGVIQEVDFETEKILSEYYVKPGFFRAHPFEPDPESLCQPLARENDYVLGELKRPERMKEEDSKEINFEEAVTKNVPEIRFRRQEDIFYVEEVDHMVEKVYFVGKETGVWKVDYDDTYQTMDVFRTADYRICMWLDHLPADTYQLFIKVNGVLMSTKKRFSVEGE